MSLLFATTTQSYLILSFDYFEQCCTHCSPENDLDNKACMCFSVGLGGPNPKSKTKFLCLIFH